MRAFVMLLLIPLLLFSTADAQPSSSFFFSFRFFNNNGGIVTLEKFCNDFKVLQQSRHLDFCNEAYYSKQSIYNAKSGRIRLYSSTVYQPVDISFIEGADTMVVFTINSGYGAIVNIDSLNFKPGLFAIECEPRVVDGKTSEHLPELHLKEIDYEKAKVKYYNYWLEKFKALLKSKVFPIYDNNVQTPVGQFFRHAQLYYNIRWDDLVVKTAEQLKAPLYKHTPAPLKRGH